MLNNAERAKLHESLEPLREAVRLSPVPQAQVGVLAHAFRRFETLSRYPTVHVEDAWTVNGDGREFPLALLRLVSVVEEVRGQACYGDIGKATYNELHFAGYLHGRRDYGRTLIRPEGLADKLIEWIAPSELDFPEYPAFCRRCYVISKDAEMFRAAASGPLLELLADFKGPHLEFQGRHLLFRWPRVIGADTARDTAELGLSLASCEI